MSSANLEKVIEEVKALTPDEQRQVRKLLDELLEESTPISPGDLLARRLLESGMISRIPKRPRDPKRHKEFKPIEVKGKPVSETIIEERR